jgi:hypothetical protein
MPALQERRPNNSESCFLAHAKAKKTCIFQIQIKCLFENYVLNLIYHKLFSKEFKSNDQCYSSCTAWQHEWPKKYNKRHRQRAKVDEHAVLGVENFTEYI